MLPAHLRTLARVGAEVALDVPVPATIASTLDALEARYPMLRGTIRDHDTLRRRPFIRYFACEEDISHQPTEMPLPEAIVTAREPLIVLGAIAGG
jgi:sulfur-carrier protein